MEVKIGGDEDSGQVDDGDGCEALEAGAVAPLSGAGIALGAIAELTEQVNIQH